MRPLARAAVAIKQFPAALVNPVFTPIAPEYSQRSALRFWMWRGGPKGAGMSLVLVSTTRLKSALW
jgi:hypothetical protein